MGCPGQVHQKNQPWGFDFTSRWHWVWGNFARQVLASKAEIEHTAAFSWGCGEPRCRGVSAVHRGSVGWLHEPAEIEHKQPPGKRNQHGI